MSLRIGNSSDLFGGRLIQSDERNALPYHQWGTCNLRPIANFYADGALWTRSRGMGNQFSPDIILSSDASTNSFTFELNPGQDDSGGRQMKKIIGYTLDSVGAPLGSCLIQGYLSSTEQFIGQTYSDTAGYYELTTAFAGQAHYIVAYKSGSPDVAGTSVNTLMPV